jgi:hypothetical protein
MGLSVPSEFIRTPAHEERAPYSDGHLGGTTPVLVKAQPVADHLFVSPNGGFDPAPLGVS